MKCSSVLSCVPQRAPTWCRLNYVCRVSQAHEIKLVEAPGLLVSCLHGVLPPLVNHLISWVPIWNYRQRVCLIVVRPSVHIIMMDFPRRQPLTPPAETFAFCWRLVNEKTVWEGDRGRRQSGLNEGLSSASHWFHLDVGLDLHTMPSEPGCALKIDCVGLMTA